MSREKAPAGADSADDAFLSRWSRRKLAARRSEPPGEAARPDPAFAAAPPSIPQATAPAPLPDVETLTPESDFTPFMRAEVDEPLKRRALKTLFQDPRFNVMDGLDVYIDDFSKPDPLPEGWLEKMNQVARLGEYHAPVEPADEASEKVFQPADSREPLAAVPPSEPLPLDTGEKAETASDVPESRGKPGEIAP